MGLGAGWQLEARWGSVLCEAAVAAVRGQQAELVEVVAVARLEPRLALLGPLRHCRFAAEVAAEERFRACVAFGGSDHRWLDDLQSRVTMSAVNAASKHTLGVDDVMAACRARLLALKPGSQAVKVENVATWQPARPH